MCGCSGPKNNGGPRTLPLTDPRSRGLLDPTDPRQNGNDDPRTSGINDPRSRGAVDPRTAGRAGQAGDPRTSGQDLTIAQRLMQAGQLNDIELQAYLATRNQGGLASAMRVQPTQGA